MGQLVPLAKLCPTENPQRLQSLGSPNEPAEPLPLPSLALGNPWNGCSPSPFQFEMDGFRRWNSCTSSPKHDQ